MSINLHILETKAISVQWFHNAISSSSLTRYSTYLLHGCNTTNLNILQQNSYYFVTFIKWTPIDMIIVKYVQLFWNCCHLDSQCDIIHSKTNMHCLISIGISWHFKTIFVVRRYLSNSLKQFTPVSEYSGGGLLYCKIMQIVF
jgi:hypothetical protein